MSTNQQGEGKPNPYGKYDLQQRLGQGGMAEVWKAFDTQLQRYVAIKLLHANLQADPDFVARFMREAQLIASLHHPNIVQIHDFQFAQTPEFGTTTAYMVMDYVEGGTLDDYMRGTSARGNIPAPVEILNLFTSISLAIDYAHQKGMIHRDIKPANILLDKRNTIRNPMGEPILTDFGVAKLLGVTSGTLSEAHLGTPLYIAPEQAQGLPGNERSDLYSLGVILYEMVTGVTPFQADTPVGVMAQHINATPRSPSLVNPRIPPALSSVILQSLAKDPNARFPSASAMTAAMATALNMPVSDRLGSRFYATGPTNVATSPATQSPVAATPALSNSGSSAFATPEGATTPNTGQWAPTPTTAAQPHPVSAEARALETPWLSSPTPLLTPAPTPSIPPPAPKKRRKGLYLILATLLIIALLASSVGAYFLFLGGKGVPANAVVGHASFFSSGQLKSDSAQGIADQLGIDLQNISDPQSGKSYYAWLLGDIHPSVEADPLQPPLALPLPILLGKLSVNQGAVHFLYQGDSQHDNLFSVTSRLLITEEDANATPKGPSADHSTWRYYAQIPQTPFGPLHLSGLDHIRHLFYKESGVRDAVLGLAGGLDIWQLRDTEKLLEAAGSARDAWQSTPTDRSQYIRVLDYIDGLPNTQVDLAPGIPVLANLPAAKVGLLDVDPSIKRDFKTNPPPYLKHVPLHLTAVIGAPDSTPEQRKLATQIIQALNNATLWIGQVHQDAHTLANMTDAQLQQPATLALLDDMVTNATYAYLGQLDLTTNTVKPGILQVHYDIQKLATFTITADLPKSL